MPIVRSYLSTRLVRFKDIVPSASVAPQKQESENTEPQHLSEGSNIILLGRYGDILNILPLVKEQRATLWVGKDFKDAEHWSSSISIKALPYDVNQLRAAVAHVRESEPQRQTLAAQVYIQSNAHMARSHGVYSFCEESYRLCGEVFRQRFLEGRYEKFDKFDEASLSREILNKIPTEPFLLIHAKGLSSPLTFDLEKWAEREFPTLPKVVLDHFKFDRFIDALEIIRRARCCVVLDSGFMHLIGLATDTPYFAFVNDAQNFWYAGYTRGNCRARIPYSTFPAWLTYLRVAIENYFRSREKIAIVSPGHFPFNAEARKRIYPSQISQRFVADLVGAQKVSWTPTRFFRDSEERRLPYVRDLFDWCLIDQKFDAVLYLNDDIIILPESAMIIHFLQKEKKPAMWYRQTRTMVEPFREPVLNVYGENLIIDGGADGVWMPRKAWLNIRHRFPDMVFGAHLWDNIMTVEISHVGGLLLYSGIIHSSHVAVWRQGRNRQTLPSQQHNTRLAIDYVSQNSWASRLLPWIKTWFNVMD